MGARIRLIEPTRDYVDLTSDWRVSTRERAPGPPERVDAMTIGLISTSENAPHGGEVHPDGEEILIVISGRIRVTGDSALDEPVEVGPGQAAVVERGEWHRVEIVEPAQFLHLTPGPGGDHRPLPSG